MRLPRDSIREGLRRLAKMPHVDCGEGWTWDIYSDNAHGPNGEKISMVTEEERLRAPTNVRRARLAHEIALARRQLARLEAQLEAIGG